MGVPEPTYVPPQLPEYHSQIAPVPKDPPVTVRVVDSPGHTALGVADAPVGALDSVLILTITSAQDVVLQSPSALT